MEVESFELDDRTTAVHRNGEIIAILVDGHPVELREEGFATIHLIEAVKELCRLRGWPDEAIAQVEHSVFHWRAPKVHGVGGPGLHGRVPFWSEVSNH